MITCFSSNLQVSPGLVHGVKIAVDPTPCFPFDIGITWLLKHRGGIPIDDKLSILILDFSIALAVDGIVLHYAEIM